MGKTDKELATEIIVAMINKDPKLFCEKDGSRVVDKDVGLGTVLDALIDVHKTLNDLGQSKEIE